MTTRHDEAGLTVAELAVTLLIMSIATFVIFGFIDNTTRITSRASRHVQAEEDVRIAMRTASQEIRGAKPLASTYPTSSPSCPTATSYPTGYSRCLAFEVKRPAAAGAACPKSVIVYGVRDGLFREDRTDYDASCTVTRSYAGRRLLSGIVNGSSAPVFTFYDKNGNVITGTTSADIERYVTAHTVKLRLQVQYQQGAPPLDLSSSLSLRNNR